jgi:hypothetical protein
VCVSASATHTICMRRTHTHTHTHTYRSNYNTRLPMRTDPCHAMHPYMRKRKKSSLHNNHGSKEKCWEECERTVKILGTTGRVLDEYFHGTSRDTLMQERNRQAVMPPPKIVAATFVPFCSTSRWRDAHRLPVLAAKLFLNTHFFSRRATATARRLRVKFHLDKAGRCKTR